MTLNLFVDFNLGWVECSESFSDSAIATVCYSSCLLPLLPFEGAGIEGLLARKSPQPPGESKGFLGRLPCGQVRGTIRRTEEGRKERDRFESSRENPVPFLSASQFLTFMFQLFCVSTKQVKWMCSQITVFIRNISQWPWMFSFRDKLDTDIYRKILGNKTSSQMIAYHSLWAAIIAAGNIFTHIPSPQMWGLSTP